MIAFSVNTSIPLCSLVVVNAVYLNSGESDCKTGGGSDYFNYDGLFYNFIFLFGLGSVDKNRFLLLESR